MKKYILYLSTLFLMTSCLVIKISSSNHFPTVKNNVCKSLTSKVVLYGVFVDSENTHPWSDYDINSTLDSIKRAIYWIEKQASDNNINLDIDFKYFSNRDIIPVNGKFKYETLSSTLFHFKDIKKGINLVDKWSNNVSRIVAKGLPKEKSKQIRTKNKLSDRERLIARLRDLYKTDNLALIFFTNNYFENEISVTLHNGDTEQVEYAIVSEKRPSVIAHEFLHLFGAVDFYQTPFDRSYRQLRKKKKIMNLFPNEIMAFAYRKIDSLTISPITKYLIGWDNKMDETYRGLIAPKNFKFVKY